MDIKKAQKASDLLLQKQELESILSAIKKGPDIRSISFEVRRSANGVPMSNRVVIHEDHFGWVENFFVSLLRDVIHEIESL